MGFLVPCLGVNGRVPDILSRLSLRKFHSRAGKALPISTGALTNFRKRSSAFSSEYPLHLKSFTPHIASILTDVPLDQQVAIVQIISFSSTLVKTRPSSASRTHRGSNISFGSSVLALAEKPRDLRTSRSSLWVACESPLLEDHPAISSVQYHLPPSAYRAPPSQRTSNPLAMSNLSLTSDIHQERVKGTIINLALEMLEGDKLGRKWVIRNIGSYGGSGWRERYVFLNASSPVFCNHVFTFPSFAVQSCPRLPSFAP